MALRRLALVVSLSASVAAAACGFTEDGALEASVEGGVGGPSTSGGGGDGDGASSSEAGSSGSSGSSGSTVDGSSSGVPVCNPPGCALPTPPAGWELVLYGTSRTDACPTGFDQADPIESPTAGANACACAACVKTGTTCTTGTIPTKADNGGGGCGSTASNLDANNGNCQNLNGSFGVDALILAPPAVRGTCTSAASPVPANVMSQPRRLCRPQPSTCTASACGGPASMQACIAAQGDVACPSGTKHLVGADVALACPSCGCSITAATCGGTMDFFGQSNCSGSATTLTVGVCKFTNSAGIGSAKWKGVVASETCVTTPVAPTTTLTSMQTVCCP